MSKHNVNDYIRALRAEPLAPHQKRMLQAHYFASHKTLTAAQMSKTMGWHHRGAANIHYGRLGRLIGAHLGWRRGRRWWVAVLSTFEKLGREWGWVMRPELAKALQRLRWFNDKESLIPEEIDDTAALYEGSKRSITVNAYERNNVARQQCIREHGCKCAVCGILLADIYGDIAQGYVHVHHTRPLAQITRRYRVNPVQDLRPVCPNCHSIIHIKKPAYAIEEARALIAKHGKSGSAKRPTAPTRP